MMHIILGPIFFLFCVPNISAKGTFLRQVENTLADVLYNKVDCGSLSNNPLSVLSIEGVEFQNYHQNKLSVKVLNQVPTLKSIVCESPIPLPHKLNGRHVVLEYDINPKQRYNTTTYLGSQYLSVAVTNSILRFWAKKYPKLVELNRIGKSYLGLEVLSLSLTDKEVKATEKKKLLFNAGLHSREVIGPISILHSLETYLNLYDANDYQFRDIVKTLELHFVPVSNPDGYTYCLTTNKVWRKNLRRNSDQSWGVDLNRNFNDHYGLGASTLPTSEVYQGTKPNSELEVQNLVNLVFKLGKVYGFIDFHSFSQTILRPYGWYSDPINSNESYLIQLSNLLIDTYRQFNFNFTSSTAGQFYLAGGAFDDWMGSQGTPIVLTLELCPKDGANLELSFHPPVHTIKPCLIATSQATLTFINYLKLNPNIPNSFPIIKT